jgi:hypothetical protein
MGEPRVPDGKTIVTYPRDMIAVVSALLAIARTGVMLESYARLTKAVRGADKEEKEPPPAPMLPLLGVNPNFGRVSVVAPDGTEYTAEVKRGEVIEGDAQRPS